jgi:serine/threonine-protein kinase HipA
MMRKADIFMHDVHAGVLEEISPRTTFRFTYDTAYVGPPVSLTAPVRPEPYEYETFPAFLEGLLPEGYNLEALLRAGKSTGRIFSASCWQWEGIWSGR